MPKFILYSKIKQKILCCIKKYKELQTNIIPNTILIGLKIGKIFKICLKLLGRIKSTIFLFFDKKTILSI